MASQYWRIATRRRRAPLTEGWDIGQTPMIKSVALAKVAEFDRRYPAYQHRVVCLPERRIHRRKDSGGTSDRSPHQAIPGEQGAVPADRVALDHDEALREDWQRRAVAHAGKDWATHRAKFNGTVVPRGGTSR